MATATLNIVSDRSAQIYPTLTSAQVQTARGFASGKPRRFKVGEGIYTVGDRAVPAWLVLEGSIEITRRDGPARQARLAVAAPGQFTGEISQLAGSPALGSAHAGEKGCFAIPFDAAHLRALLIGSVDVGETVMRALILRRVGLIAAAGSGSILVGEPESAAVRRILQFLTRSGYPVQVLPVAGDGEGHQIAERLGVAEEDLPLLLCPNGTILRNPTTVQAAACLGITPQLDLERPYDVAIVGAGPAGLAAAVYGASEGLRVVVLEGRERGGQAGASNRIENYLGFPTGISGEALTGRAFAQALKFGAEIAIPVEVEKLECEGVAELLTLNLSGEQRIRARTLVIASGAHYRRPTISNLSEFESAGISYWASPIEARLCAGETVALIGGGNSAGQAVVFLAPQVAKLDLFVRRSLEATMSRYLIDRIAALPNVEIHVGQEIAALEGDAAGLAAATFRDIGTGHEQRWSLRHLFIFIGADPNTAFVRGCVEVDAAGFIKTGMDFAGQALSCGRTALLLETSRPSIFAIGDVRAGSTKRVAAAVGEGAAAIAQVHIALAHHQAQRQS